MTRLRSQWRLVSVLMERILWKKLLSEGSSSAEGLLGRFSFRESFHFRTRSGVSLTIRIAEENHVFRKTGWTLQWFHRNGRLWRRFWEDASCLKDKMGWIESSVFLFPTPTLAMLWFGDCSEDSIRSGQDWSPQSLEIQGIPSWSQNKEEL